MIDPVDLTARLVRCPSITPEEGGALLLLEDLLTEGGFTCTRVDRNGTSNLFARWGEKGHPRTFGFNGHTDVVPLGDVNEWTKPPFGAEIEDGWMYGRGATDMKSGVAAFAAAALELVRETPPDGALILAITGDEEGPATDGTVALLDWMEAEGEAMTDCLVGEPTSAEEMGDMMKIGRRGSISAFFTVTGTQGHVAYPHKALNPMPALVALMDRLARHELDRGNDHFDPSTLAITTIDTGNTATNVIPAETHGVVNIRFNDAHTSASLTDWMQSECDRIARDFGVEVAMSTRVSGESFLTPPGPLTELVARAVQRETNRVPDMSTGGGTSDARFVMRHCPVVEFGLVGHRMHAVDERVRVEQIGQLKNIYLAILRDYFA